MTTQIARHWRLNAQRYGLVGDLCPDCNRKIFPPREVCPHCAEKTSLPFQFDRQLETNSYPTIHGIPQSLRRIVPHNLYQG